MGREEKFHKGATIEEWAVVIFTQPRFCREEMVRSVTITKAFLIIRLKFSLDFILRNHEKAGSANILRFLILTNT